MAKVVAWKTAGEPPVTEAELMQQRGVQVVDVDGTAHHGVRAQQLIQRDGPEPDTAAPEKNGGA